jgi:phytoene dehydrogenase-like protein
MTPADLETYNANYPGGDITGGALTLRQVLFRPRMRLDPYRIGRRLWLCSAAAPPGAGVHGMCGYHAARSVLRAPE